MIERVRNKNKCEVKQQLPIITIITLSVVTLVILLSSYMSYRIWVTDAEAQRTDQLAQLQAQQQANTVSVFVAERQNQLDTFAARSSMVTIAQTESSSLISTGVSSIQRAFDDAQAVRIFSLDRQERISGNTQSKLSFTELDMINRAERGEKVAPEANKGEGGWRLLFIATIRANDSEAISGTLMITLPASSLFDVIANSQPELGQTRLLRRTTIRPALIAEFNQGGMGNEQQAEVDKTEWIIAYSASPQLAAQANQSILIVLLPSVLLGLILLGASYWITGKIDPVRKAAKKTTPTAGSVTIGTASSTPMATTDILDIQVSEEDNNLLALEEVESTNNGDPTLDSAAAIELPDQIFRAYDIRGIYGEELTEELAVQIGQAMGTQALAAGESSLFVARDGRNHSPALTEKLIAGILSSGCNVVNLGAVPTPLLYFACFELPDSNSGVMVTASHNAGHYNGFKLVLNGSALAGDEILDLKSRIMRGDFSTGAGEEITQQVVPEYIDRIFGDVALAGDVKIVIDAANGITGDVAPLLFEELGCEVVPLFCDVDGDFPNHDPDPTVPANLNALINEVREQQADLGVAFDGDGDRLMIVTPNGEIIWPDRLLMLFAKDVVSRNPGADVIFDVKCTRELNSLITNYGGRPIMWKTGHSHMKAKMKETGALLAGEQSGHIFIKDRWYGFDDGMYACARLLEIMTLRDQPIDELFENFPTLPNTPEIKVAVEESEKFNIIEQLIKQGKFQNGKASTIDGLRVDFARGWGLVRASNTSPALTLRFEAEDESIIQQMQELFKRELLKVSPTLDLPF